jgi:hypothetical protein
MFASKAARACLMVVTAAVATVGVAAPASAATTTPTETAVWNASGVGPQGSLTVSVKCPSTYPYVVSGVGSGTNGAVLGPVTLANYPAVNKMPFSNPYPLSSNQRVTARLDVICTRIAPVG